MNFGPLIKEFKRNYIIASLGIVLLVVGSLVLSVNERESFRHTSSLEEALKAAQTIGYDFLQRDTDNAKSKNYEGQIIHVSGPLRVQEPIAESTYNIMVQAIKLRKIVQMYQWHEDYTENQFAQDESSSRNYFYYKDWNEKVVDSRSFHMLGHQNPTVMPMQSSTMTAEKAFIGKFEIGDAAKDLFNKWIDVTSDTRPEDNYVKMHSGMYYHIDDLFDPQIGDLRLKFQFAGLEDDMYTIVGELRNGKIQPYRSKVKKQIILLAKGELTIDEIFKQEHHSVKREIWIVRFFGFMLIFFGVISTEGCLRIIFSGTKFSHLSPDIIHPLRSKLKAAAIISIVVCVARHALHYLGLMK